MQSEISPSRRGLPAWGVSVVVHVLLAAGLVLLLRRVEPIQSMRADRDTGIVLVQRDVAGQARYFQEEESNAPGDASELRAGRDSQSSAMPAAAPPVDAAGLLANKIAGLQHGADGNLVQSLDAGAGGGRGRVAFDRKGEDALRIDPGDATRPGAPRRRVTLFGASATGSRFVFLLDHSASMGEGRLGALPAARKQLTAALAMLSPRQKFQIIAYSRRPTRFSKKGLLPATDENRRRAGEFLRGISAAGPTEHKYALNAALAERPDVIFLLTDAGEPPLTLAQIKNITWQNSKQKASIVAIQFGVGPLEDQRPFLKRLALSNFGQFRYVRDGE